MNIWRRFFQPPTRPYNFPDDIIFTPLPISSIKNIKIEKDFGRVNSLRDWHFGQNNLLVYIYNCFRKYLCGASLTKADHLQQSYHANVENSTMEARARGINCIANVNIIKQIYQDGRLRACWEGTAYKIIPLPRQNKVDDIKQINLEIRRKIITYVDEFEFARGDNYKSQVEEMINYNDLITNSINHQDLELAHPVNVVFNKLFDKLLFHVNHSNSALRNQYRKEYNDGMWRVPYFNDMAIDSDLRLCGVEEVRLVLDQVPRSIKTINIKGNQEEQVFIDGCSYRHVLGGAICVGDENIALLFNVSAKNKHWAVFYSVFVFVHSCRFETNKVKIHLPHQVYIDKIQGDQELLGFSRFDQLIRAIRGELNKRNLTVEWMVGSSSAASGTAFSGVCSSTLDNKFITSLDRHIRMHHLGDCWMITTIDNMWPDMDAIITKKRRAFSKS
ncbi:hypothetical protein AKO1_005008 [Acrasis kona]|uniref:Uncharacterized protein n=1 Tax=Acrasis kona TaxID=1008807 RepID=A0AAW2Z4N4_9EUKA